MTKTYSSEQSLPPSKTRYYEDIFDNSPVAMCLVQNRTLTHVNRRFEELVGYDTGELTSQSVRVLYPSDEAFELIGRKFDHFFEGKSLFRDERLVVRKDGTIIWCIVTGRLLDPSTPRRGRIWVLQDISEHKQAEETLKANVENLEFLVQQRTVELKKMW